MHSDQGLKNLASPDALRLTTLPVEILGVISAFVCTLNNTMLFRFEHKADKSHSFVGLRILIVLAEHAKRFALSYSHYFTGTFLWLCHGNGQVWRNMSSSWTRKRMDCSGLWVSRYLSALMYQESRYADVTTRRSGSTLSPKMRYWGQRALPFKSIANPEF